MKSALEEACPGSGAERAIQGFDFEMECAITCFQRGGLSRNSLVRMTRSHEEQAARFCIDKLGNPGNPAAYRTVLSYLLRQPEVFRHFADALLTESEPGKRLCLPISRRQQATERCISALRQDEGFTFPLLLELQHTEDEGILARIAKLAERLRLDFVYSAYLLLHSPVTIRVAALESMLARRHQDGLPYFRLCICDPEPQVRAVAALGLCTNGDSLGMRSLIEMASHGDGEIRTCATAALTRLDRNALLSLMDSVDWREETAKKGESFVM
jgi:hypothetical protein